MLEREILGCFIKENELIKETKILPSYFKSDVYKQLFDTMKEMSLEEKAIDKVSLIAECYDLINSNGMELITDLEAIGNINNYETYEKKMIEEYNASKSNKIAREYIIIKDDKKM